MISEAELRRLGPHVPWEEPVEIHVVGERRAGEDWYGWSCRYCIAMRGLKAADLVHDRAPDFVYRSRVQALEHIRATHAS